MKATRILSLSFPPLTRVDSVLRFTDLVLLTRQILPVRFPTYHRLAVVRIEISRSKLGVCTPCTLSINRLDVWCYHTTIVYQ
jgi:hypothetical protein